MIDARAAVLLDARADRVLTDVQIRPPVTDEVLVRIDAVRICHTVLTYDSCGHSQSCAAATQVLRPARPISTCAVTAATPLR